MNSADPFYLPDTRSIVPPFEYRPYETEIFVPGVIRAAPSAPLAPSAPDPDPDPYFPFQIFATSSTSIQVAPGTVNGFMPSNVLTNIAMTGSGTEYVMLDITSGSDKVTGCSLSVTATTPPGVGSGAGSAPASFSIPVGLLIDGNPFNSINTSFYVKVVEQSTTASGTFYIWVIE